MDRDLDLVQVPAQLINILEDPLGQPAVGVGVDEEFHVEHVPHLSQD